MITQSFQHRHTQRGVALPVVLIMLVVLVMPTLIMLRSTLVSEKMSAASIDRGNAFQAAEAGLVAAETFALARPEPPASGCANGICATPDPAAAPRWETPGFWDGGIPRLAAPVGGVTPRYIIEFMGVSQGLDHDCTTSGDVSPDAACNDEANLYRVTSFAKTESGGQALLQTSYMVP